MKVGDSVKLKVSRYWADSIPTSGTVSAVLSKGHPGIPVWARNQKSVYVVRHFDGTAFCYVRKELVREGRGNMKPGTRITKKNYKQLLGQDVFILSEHHNEVDGMLRVVKATGKAQFIYSDGEWTKSELHKATQEASFLELFRNYPSYTHLLVEATK